MPADFLDFSIFVYLFDETDARKRRRAEALVLASIDEARGCISFQVVEETLNVLTRRLTTPLTPEDARRFLETVLLPLWTVNPSPELYSRALEIRARYDFSFYDALILAAALEAGCSQLWTEDLQHGQQIEELTIVNPFREEEPPESS